MLRSQLISSGTEKEGRCDYFQDDSEIVILVDKELQI